MLTGPTFEFTTQLATLEPPPPEVQQVLQTVSSSPDAMDAFVSMVAGTLSPIDFSPEHLEKAMRTAAAA
jgi:hypothetical protein